ncbi:unnamed protein product [Brassica oleracea var. botrytis]|uniref:MYB-CC type transcription factor LHEQLE-containing domain-containing protein n=3 Tax=Brassica TaxID=3705 RepID=A0A0D3CM70_BRAOL|nr:hypothetical protein Bca52824_067295 [Brassica carinata]VDD47150.1 unnamed protein product [Brassica oleracea]
MARLGNQVISVDDGLEPNWSELLGGVKSPKLYGYRWKFRKKLHEQLEVQRTLQLQIEEQGRYLQMMIEKQQQKMQEKKNVSFFWLIIDARS